MRNEAEEEMTTTVEEEEDEGNGLPPGFHPISPAPSLDADAEPHEVFDEEEGPPPGFDSIAPKPAPASADILKDSQRASLDEEEDEEELDGPPPGWEIRNPSNQPLQTSPDIKGNSGEKVDSHDDLDEGPPPGWETVLPNKMTPPSMPPLLQSSTLTSSLDIKLKIAPDVDEDKVILSESEDVLTTPSHSPSPAPLLEEDHLPTEQTHGGTSLPEKDCEDSTHISRDQSTSPQKQPQKQHRSVSSSVFTKEGDDNSHISMHRSTSQQQQQQQQLGSVSSSACTEKAQLVCGTCQKLCLYPVGTKWVQCPSCNEVNFVLEASEVGQVVCGGCSILLMYPHGAPAVQCSSCQFVTQIGEHNKRPPLSVQQAKLRRHRCKRAR